MERPIEVLPSLLMFCLTQAKPTPAEFADAFRSRASIGLGDSPDRARRKAIRILTDAVLENLVEHPRASDRQIDSWLTPFQKAIPHRNNRNPVDAQDSDMDVYVNRVGGYRFIVAQMGYLVRTVACDSAGKEIKLPPDFDACYWIPNPKKLMASFVLMEETTTFAQGNTVPEQLVWLKVVGNHALKACEFKGTTTLEYEPAVISGGLVTARTEDPPLALEFLSADFALERDRTWDCSTGAVRLIRSEPKQLALRAVDSAIFNARHAKHPTYLQTRIRQFFSSHEDLEMDDWTESRPRNGVVWITINEDTLFEVRRSRRGLKVVNIRHKKNRPKTTRKTPDLDDSRGVF